MEDIDAEGVEPMMRLPEYIPPRKGKAKVMKDLDTGKFLVSTPLLPEQVVFEGPRLSHIPLLKMEDWDLTDTQSFLTWRLTSTCIKSTLKTRGLQLWSP